MGMASAPPLRSRLHRSPLLRLLDELRLAEGSAGTTTLAERLGQWMGWTDAITLSSALQGSGEAPASASANAVADALAPAAKTLSKLRADITARLPPESPIHPAAEYPEYRQYHLARQRMMLSRIGPARAELRQRLARQSSALRQLAALDAAWDEALAARERHLLARLPAWLEDHFRRLRAAHPDPNPAATLAVPGATPSTTLPALPAWLTRFRQDQRTLLLAELDLRLQPLEGLAEALDADLHARAVATPGAIPEATPDHEAAALP